jgi:hypothetical protein
MSSAIITEIEEERKKGKIGNKHDLDRSFDPPGILVGVRRSRRAKERNPKN